MKYQTEEKIKLKFEAIKEPKSFWKDKKVVDIGCNVGLLYPLLKDCGIKEYIGIDDSKEYIDEARDLFPEAKFRLQDLREYEGLADIGVCLSTLHIFDDTEFANILEKFSRQFEVFIFEVPVKGTAPIYYTRSEEYNLEVAGYFFSDVMCYGISPSPHDIQSTRKVFKCTN